MSTLFAALYTVYCRFTLHWHWAAATTDAVSSPVQLECVHQAAYIAPQIWLTLQL